MFRSKGPPPPPTQVHTAQNSRSPVSAFAALSQTDKVEANRAELKLFHHREGQEAPKASARSLCCPSLLNDEESVKNDWHIFQTYFTSSPL